jgi:hypothetical protein
MTQEAREPKQELETRTYPVGLEFPAEDRVECRWQEQVVNQRIKELQQRMHLDKEGNVLITPSIVDQAIEHVRENPSKKATFLAAELADLAGNRGNLQQSMFYYLANAVKGTLDQEGKLTSLLEALKEWPEQALEWVLFGRSPRVEKRMARFWRVKFDYARNLVLSARRVLNRHLEQAGLFEELSLDLPLPVLTVEALEQAIEQSYAQKQEELYVNGEYITTNVGKFMKKYALLLDNKEQVSQHLHEWILKVNDPEELKRWKTLKQVCKALTTELNTSANLLSAVRAILVSAFSPILSESVNALLETVTAEQVTARPFIKERTKLAPIALLMGASFVVIRPGNAKVLTQLAREYGRFLLEFPKTGIPRLTAEVVIHRRLRQILLNGARIRHLMIKSTTGPSNKIIVSVVVEGSGEAFRVSSKYLSSVPRLLFDHVEGIGVDANKVGEHAIVLSDLELPPSLLLFKLCERYDKLTQKTLPELHKALTRAEQEQEQEQEERDYTKIRGELNRVYNRRSRLLKTIQLECSRVLAAVLVQGTCECLVIEDLVVSARGTRGALAKAIYNMPDDESIFERAVRLASNELEYEVELIKVDPRGTSKYHYGCRGELRRTKENWDYATCSKCGDWVNTHQNASQNIRDKGFKLRRERALAAAAIENTATPAIPTQ